MSEERMVDTTGISDSVEVEIKGPGKQWKWRDQILLEQEEAEEEKREAVDTKGPGEEWETDDEGVYIYRDEDE